MQDFFYLSSHSPREMTISELLEKKRLERDCMHKTYESPRIFDVDNPYGPSGIYDEREIPFPLVPKKQ